MIRANCETVVILIMRKKMITIGCDKWLFEFHFLGTFYNTSNHKQSVLYGAADMIQSDINWPGLNRLTYTVGTF